MTPSQREEYMRLFQEFGRAFTNLVRFTTKLTEEDRVDLRSEFKDIREEARQAFMLEGKYANH